LSIIKSKKIDIFLKIIFMKMKDNTKKNSECDEINIKILRNIEKILEK